MKLYRCKVTIKFEVFVNASNRKQAEDEVWLSLMFNDFDNELIEHVTDPVYEIKCYDGE